MAEYNYLDAYTAYVYGQCNDKGEREYPSLKELAGQLGIGHSTLAHKAASEQWQRQRQQAQDRIIEKAFEQYESELASILAQLDRQVARVSIAMVNVIEEALVNAETPLERQALVNRYSKQLPDLLNAAHNAIGVERMLERANQIIEGKK